MCVYKLDVQITSKQRKKINIFEDHSKGVKITGTLVNWVNLSQDNVLFFFFSLS